MKKIYIYELPTKEHIACITKRFVRGMGAKLLRVLTFAQFVEAEKI